MGSLLSWGRGEFGALGHGDVRDRVVPRTVGDMRGRYVSDVACGMAHTVAVDGAGNTYTWGINTQAQCGLAVGPVATAGGGGGEEGGGQPGGGSEGSGARGTPAAGRSRKTGSPRPLPPGPRPTHPPSDPSQPPPSLPAHILHPTIVPALVGVRVSAVACGAAHTVVVGDGGRRVYSWGLGKQGQLGHGTFDHCPTPTPLEELSALGVTVTAAACGLAHTALLDEGGDVWMFGWNNVGQLGLGRDADRGDLPLPTAVDRASAVVGVSSSGHPVEGFGIGAVRHLACGGGHTLIVDVHGRVFSAGSK